MFDKSTACSVNPAAKSISVALGDGGGKWEGRRISRIQFPISSLLLSPFSPRPMHGRCKIREK